MVIVWVKHAEKEYDNGKGPRGKPLFDPKCLQKSRDELEMKRFFVDYFYIETIMIRQIFFSPEVDKHHHIRIISSPFARTRGTSQRIKSVIEERFRVLNDKYNCDKNLKITIEPVDILIGEYLGNQKRIKRPLKRYEYENEVFFYKETVDSILEPQEKEKFPFLRETVPLLQERCLKHIEKEDISDYFDKFYSFNFNSPNNYKQHRIYVSHGFVIKNIISEYFKSYGIEVPKDICIEEPLKSLHGFALINKSQSIRF